RGGSCRQRAMPWAGPGTLPGMIRGQVLRFLVHGRDAMTIAPNVDTQAHRGPERPGGQGLDRNQEESGNRAIHLLLTSDDGSAWTDFVATHRAGPDGGAYEAW